MTLKFCEENIYTWYSILVFMGCYAVGELGHFLIGIVSTPIAQDLKFGDLGCIPNGTSISYEDQLSCKERNSTTCYDASENVTTLCEWNYLGSGILYQLLAGPAFIAIFSIMGIILGIIGDTYNRINLLAICVVGFSLMITLTGTSTKYWQLLILRFGFGAGEAACTPLTASLVADMFGKRSRALAMSVFNWGIYVGYGLAFIVGNFVTQANILNQGWRWAYYLTGIPGFFMACLLLCTVKEPKRKEILSSQERQPHRFNRSSSSSSVEFLSLEDKDDKESPEESYTKDDEKLSIPRQSMSSGDFAGLVDPVKKPMKNEKPRNSTKNTNFRGCRKLMMAIQTFTKNPAVLMLLLAASIRHTASFCWSYNTQLYFNYYYPGYSIAIPMLLCSIVGGSIGIASGGVISDLLVSKYGVSTRLWVLVVSQAVASPLAAMVLYLPPPYCFITLCSAYLFAEMWFGILFTVLVEIFPLRLRSTAIALFIFVMNNVASSGQLLVPTLKPTLGFRETLFLTYSGFYGLCSLFFLFAQLLLKRKPIFHSDENLQKLNDVSQ